MAEPDERLLALYERAYDDPSLIRQRGRAAFWPRQLTGAGYEATLLTFLKRVLLASPTEETRRRLRSLLADLHLRPSISGGDVMHLLGVRERWDDVLRAVHDAFSPGPLVGRCLGEALLDDERAFREVPAHELEAVRAAAETFDWRRIPGAEIERAFQMSSVYIWLDASAWPFYLPAFLSYSLHNPGGQCEYHTLTTLLDTPAADAARRWSAEQRSAIASFLLFVADDEPWESWAAEPRIALRAWVTPRPA